MKSTGSHLYKSLPDGRVSYTPCRHCGEECEGHSVNTSPDARITAYVAELPAGRTPAEYADSLARPSIHDLARRSAMAAAAKRNAEICAAAQPHCRTCGAECPPAQCDACRADGEAVADAVRISRRHLTTLADLANRAVANPPYHAEEVEALDAAARALGVDVSDPERGDRQP